ncbi:MAG TPA: hypothetical protein VLC09_04660 [Polyangiaceae bacterium]|nr:hypothetical protein [Polyangiaceae bacterium]
MFRLSWASPLGALLLCLFLSLASCRRTEEPMAGPAERLQEFVQIMSNVHGDPAQGARAVQLLWKPARDNLSERARRASALSGRTVTPGEMIAPSWFALHLVADRYESRIDGDWAEVTSIARDGSRVKSRLVREDGVWRVALELPSPSPIRQRVDESGLER